MRMGVLNKCHVLFEWPLRVYISKTFDWALENVLIFLQKSWLFHFVKILFGFLTLLQKWKKIAILIDMKMFLSTFTLLCKYFFSVEVI